MKEILPFGHFWASNYGGAGGGSPGVYEQAQLYMDFRVNQARLNGAWSSAASLLTYSRNSIGYIDDTAGNWTQISNVNTPRMSDKGLLVEVASTQSIRNSSMVGAVAGTPGTLPTFWVWSAHPGISIQVVGTGVEKGVDYIDLRFFGTTTVGTTQINIQIEPAGAIVAANGQTWAGSLFCKLVSGSFANLVAYDASMALYNSTPAFIGSGPLTSLLTASGTLNRLSWSGTLSNAAIASIVLLLQAQVNGVGLPVDYTLRIGWPQLEQNSYPTSPIVTTGVAASTRAFDLVRTAAAFVPSATQGTIFVDYTIPIKPLANVYQMPANIDDGSGTNRIFIAQITAPDLIQSTVLVANVQTMAINGTGPYTGKVAHAFSANDLRQCLNGGAVGALASGAYPAGLSFIAPGGSGLGDYQLGGYVKRLVYWNTKLTNAQLQAITA